MRKAGIAIGASAGAVVARAGGRRNKNTQNQPGGSENENNNNSNNNNITNRSNSNSPIKNKKQQQQTPDEAALTAKNYRLAKELSELRVRHREECKNATRLTMENMNLASRCRDAIGQVALLKKELASIKKQQVQQRSVTSTSSSSNTTNKAKTIIANNNRNKRRTNEIQQQQQKQQQQQQLSSSPSPSTSSSSPPSEKKKATSPQSLPSPTQSQSSPPQYSPTTTSSKTPSTKTTTTSASAAEMERMDLIIAARAAVQKMAQTTTTPSTAPAPAPPVAPVVIDGSNNNSPTSTNSTSSSRRHLVVETEDEAIMMAGVKKKKKKEMTTSSSPPSQPPRGSSSSTSVMESSSVPPSSSAGKPCDSDDFDEALNLSGVIDNANEDVIVVVEDTTSTTENSDSASRFEEEAIAQLVKDIVEGSDNTDDDDVFDSIIMNTEKESKEPDDEIVLSSRRNNNHKHISHSPKRGEKHFFPHSASPKLPARRYNEEYPGDISVQPHHNHHHHQQRQQQHHDLRNNKATGFSSSSSSDHHKDGYDDNGSIQQPHLAPFDCLKTKQDKSTMSSIDAFEASFNTSFPESFASPREATKTAVVSPTKEIYNPFSCSPAKPRKDDNNMNGSSPPWDNTTGITTPTYSRDNARGTFSANGSPTSGGSVCNTGSGNNIIRYSSDPPARDRTSPRPIYSMPVVKLDSDGDDGATTSSSIPSATISSAASSAAAAAASASLSTTSPSADSPPPAGILKTPTSGSGIAPMRRSPVPSDSSNARLPLSMSSSSSTSSNRSSPTGSASSPIVISSYSPTQQQQQQQQPSTPVLNRYAQSTTNDSGYSTPPQLNSSPTSLLSSSSSYQGPKRPEKTGHDVARARYEKAMQPHPTPSSSLKGVSAPQSVSGSSTNIRRENSNNHSPSSVPDKASLWNDAEFMSDEECAGDIPLRSSIKKKKEMRESVSTIEVNSMASLDDVSSRTRQQHPWEGKTAVGASSSTPMTANSSPSWSSDSGGSPRRPLSDEDDEMDPSNSPVSRYRRRSGYNHNNMIPSRPLNSTEPVL